MRKANLVEFTDLLSHAESMGYEWNHACDILDNIRPQYEVHSLDYCVNEFDPNHKDFDEEEEDEDVLKIMLSYFKDNKVKEITVINS